MTWLGRLEQLRREQNPRKYPPLRDQRLPLQLPVPEPPPGWEPPPRSQEEVEDSERGVIVIDL